MSGTVKADSSVYNSGKDANERIGKLYLLRGKKQIEVPELKAGDIGAATKLAVTLTGRHALRRRAKDRFGGR